MDKKKITGLVIFTLALALFMGYPQIEKYRYQRSITTMLAEGKYQEVYDKILGEDEGIEDFSFRYMALLKCEIALGSDLDASRRANNKINKIVAAKRIDLLQQLVDDMGPTLGSYLFLIDKVEGLVYDESTKEKLIYYLELNGETGRARELRGIEEVDMEFMSYLLQQRSFNKYLLYYDKVPEHLNQMYSLQLTYALIEELYKNPENASEYIKTVEKLSLPEEVFSSMGSYIAMIRSINPDIEGEYNAILNLPFFVDNPYFRMYTSLYSLNDPKKKDEALNDLIENEDYKDLIGWDAIVHRAENSTWVSQFHFVTDGGVLGYYTANGHLRIYDIANEKNVDFDPYLYLVSVSPNRNYYVGKSQEFQDQYFYIFDKNLKVIRKVEGEAHVVNWLDDSSFSFMSFDDVNNYYNEYNIVTGISSRELLDYEKEYNHLRFEPVVKDARVWSINKETYSSIEPKENYSDWGYIPGNKGYFTVRNLRDHSIIDRIEFDFIFLGSCDDFLYGAEPGAVYGLVKMDKKTGEIVELPFYSTSIFYSGLLFIDVEGNRMW